jgi:hypothetical protein
VFHREAFSINWDAKEVTCPQDKVSRRWPTPPSLAPYVTVEFSPDDRRQCPVKTACTRTDAREGHLLPHDLYDIQSASRAEQQTQEWLSRYSLRAAIESTIGELVRAQDNGWSITFLPLYPHGDNGKKVIDQPPLIVMSLIIVRPAPDAQLLR